MRRCKTTTEILHVASYYYPYISGLTLHIKNISEELAKQGYCVNLLTNLHSSKLLEHEIINKVVVYRCKPWFRLSRGFITPKIIVEFLKLISTKKQTVFLHLPLPEAFLMALIVKIFQQKCFLVYHANLNLPSWKLSSCLIETIVNLNHFLSMTLADGIVAYSRDYANHVALLSHFSSKISIITPPVKIYPATSHQVEDFRRKHHLENKIVLGFAGRFAEEKGGDILIEALPKIVDKYPNIVVAFAGETNLIYEDFCIRKQALITKYQKHIKFLGLIKPEEMSQFYKNINILVLPSRNECFGFVQIEAMLNGCPVVAFDIPGGRVPITKTNMGLLVKPYSRIGLADAIMKILSNRQKYIKNPKIINAEFGLKQSLSGYLKLLTDDSSK